MADFVSNFWHWFVAIVSMGGVLAMIPLIYFNRGEKKDGDVETMGHVWDDDLEEFNNPLPSWWSNMFYITIAFGVVYLLLYPGLGHFQGLLGWSSKGQYESEMARAAEKYDPLYEQYASEPIPELAKNEDAMRSGARLYASYCALCHGSDARGARGFPNLRDGDWLWGGEPEQIKASILNGRNGVMPPWAAALGGEQGVFNVAEYVLSLSGRRHNAAAAVQGKEKYDQVCVACHQADGTGNPALGAPNLTDRIWLYGGSQRTVMETIANGRQGRMPAHKEFLGEEKVHLLAAYVYSLSQKLEHE